MIKVPENAHVFRDAATLVIALLVVIAVRFYIPRENGLSVTVAGGTRYLSTNILAAWLALIAFIFLTIKVLKLY